MLRWTANLALLCALMLAQPCLATTEHGSRNDAVAMVQRVQDKFKHDGAAATFAAVTGRAAPFHDRDLYPFIYRLDGLAVAHGARPALVGKNLRTLKDPDGVPMIQIMVALATSKGSGWVNYKWPNPFTNAIENKTSYIERMGDYFVGVGVYQP